MASIREGISSYIILSVVLELYNSGGKTIDYFPIHLILQVNISHYNN